MIVDGPTVSGPALLLGIADLTVMTADSYAFVNGPTMVEEFTGIGIGIDELGGAANHGRYTGVATSVVADRASAIDAVTELLSYLPDHVDAEPPHSPADDPIDRRCPEAGALIPPTSTGSYDVRSVAAAIVDDGSMTELRARWASTTSLPPHSPPSAVPRSASSPTNRSPLPAPSTSRRRGRAARIVTLCDAFNLPIVTLVDTPGFYPGRVLKIGVG